jgi:hypothetical protein
MRLVAVMLIGAVISLIGPSLQGATLPNRLLIKDLPAGSVQSLHLSIENGRLSGSGAGIRATGKTERISGGWRLQFLVKNVRGGDRGSEITVAFAIPKGTASKWWKDYATAVPISQDSVYSETIPWEDVADPAFNTTSRLWRSMARFPFCTVTGPDGGVSVAVPIGSPRCFRLSFYPKAAEIRASFDLGFSDAAVKNRQQADFTVLIYDTDPHWGMRDALNKYYKYYPEYAASRVTEYGAWAVTSANSSRIICPFDFGLKYNETSYAQVAKDATHNMDSIQYSEPWARPRYAIRSWKDSTGAWHPEGSDGSRAQDCAAIVKVLKEGSGAILFGSETGLSVTPGSTMNSMVLDKDGGPVWHVEYNAGLPIPPTYMILQNCDPDIAGPSAYADTRKRWKTWGKGFSEAAGGKLGGTYMDSLTPWCGQWVDDYSRAHWAASDLPLSASWETGSPVVPQCFGNFEYISAARKDPNTWGSMILGNLGHPAFFPIFSTVLDAIGIEAGPSYGDSSDEDYRYYRSYALGKPISWLAYGMPLPEIPIEKMGACYWEDTPADSPVRSIYRRYEPVIRWFDRAGWKPVTLSSVDAGMFVERYGDSDPFFLAVRNPSQRAATGTLAIDTSLLRPGLVCRALFAAQNMRITDGKLHVKVGADDTEVYVIGTRQKIAQLWLYEAEMWLDLAGREARWINWKASAKVGEKLWLPDDRTFAASFRYHKPAGTTVKLDVVTNTCFVVTATEDVLLPSRVVKMQQVVVDKDAKTGKLLGPNVSNTDGVYSGSFKLAPFQYGSEIRLSASDQVTISDLMIATDGNSTDLSAIDNIRVGTSTAGPLIKDDPAKARRVVSSMLQNVQAISDPVTKARLDIPLTNAVSALDAALVVDQ